jgi:1,4-dihydroxy-2-naphthoate octaprenyltransferase
LIAFIRLGRPHFLVGGLLLHGLGVAMALYAGVSLNLPALLWGQAAISAIQLMTHYSNDFFDLAADRANQTPTHWSGGSRVLVEKRLRPGVALAAAVGVGILALGAALSLALVVHSGTLTLPLLILALVVAWGYSAPPVQLHSRGLGELTVALLVPGLVPLVGFYLQTGQLEPLPLLAVMPLGCLQFAMLLVIEFPDAAGDAAVGKRTLVVRLGEAKAAYLHASALLAAYAALPLLVLLGLPLAAAAAAGLSAPLAIWQGWCVLRAVRTPSPRWNSPAFWSIGLLLSTAAAETLAFLWLSLPLIKI